MADLIAYLHFLHYIDPPGNPSAGRALFRSKGCVTCHSAAGEGGTLAPDLSQSAAASSPIEWASRMWNHAPAMEQLIKERELPWPRFTAGEMRDLVAYVRSGAPTATSSASGSGDKEPESGH
jgi:mono/diheme cytochrome c family protein